MALKLLAVMASLSLSGAFVAPRRQVRMCAADQVSADSALLREAALARTAEPEAVYTAIRRLEKARAMDGEKIGEALNGDWRLIFTSGEKKTQDAMGGAKISYVPIKAVQSFRTENGAITNGVYFGNTPILQFTGDFRFAPEKRRLEFDFYRLKFFGNDITDSMPVYLKDGAGLKREGTEYKRQPFFTFFWVDDAICVGRGGGGGVAVWANTELIED